MSFFYQLRAIFTLTFKRLWAQRWMTAATAVGLIMAVALMMTVPLYADAVNFRILQEELSSQTARNNRPPFAYLYNYIGAWHEPVDWEAVQPITEYLQGQGGRTLGLPVELLVSHFETNDYRLYAAENANYNSQDASLTDFKFATTSDMADHIVITEGAWPAAAPSAAAAPFDVLVSTPFATELGLQVGEEYIAYNPRSPRNQPQTFPIRVAGVWTAANPDEAYWLYAVSSFDDLFMVPAETYDGRIAALLDDEVHLGAWYLVLDGSRVRTDDVDRLVAGAARVERQLDTLLPETGSLQSPEKSLQAYRRAVSSLTVQLLAFNVPTVGLALAFIGLVVGLAVSERRNEIAVMRSRGGTPYQVVGIAALEGVVLGAISFAAGTGLALVFTQLMGRTRSFLDFSAESVLRVVLTPTALWAGVIAIGIALVAQLIPTFAAAGHTIITYKQERARAVVRPWWQRAWLDALLFAVAAYGIYQLQQQGSLIVDNGGDVFQNPLLFLLPALTIFSVTLFFLRLLPWVMHLASWLLTFTDSVSALQAARYLARTPRFYSTPLILLVLTVSLAVYTASLARTMDYQLYDQAYYRIGADVNLFTSPNPLGDTSRFGFSNQDSNRSDTYIFLPVSEYTTIPGVQAAARVGEYPGSVEGGDGRETVTFLGLDRLDFARVAYWRWDFSAYRLGSLLNGIGGSESGVVVSRNLLRETGVQVGDVMRMTVNIEGQTVPLNVQVVGVFDYFPTWDPAGDDPLVVGDLNRLFEQAGGEFPYRVWLTTDGPVDDETFVDELNARRLVGTTWVEPFSLIEVEQIKPERQGLFGLLSIGFSAAAVLTVLGFFLYAVFSFRRRVIELGILRAVGLSAGSMMRLVGWELALLILSGIVLGTVLGVAVSRLFVPYLQVGGSSADLVPPYLVEIAWAAVFQIYVLFGLLFVVALGALSILLRRMKIFQAVKLGETV